MSDLQKFRESVTRYRKRKDNAEGRPHTQTELAQAIGLSPDELGHRLRGTGRIPLTKENILSIVLTLAEWDTLTWQEAVGLLTSVDYPLDSSHWKTELQRFLSPLAQSVQDMPGTFTDTLQKKMALPHKIREAFSDDYTIEHFEQEFALYASHIEQSLCFLKLVGIVPKDIGGEHRDPELASVFIPLRITFPQK